MYLCTAAQVVVNNDIGFFTLGPLRRVCERERAACIYLVLELIDRLMYFLVQ